jgi:hypothetical protein
MQGDDLHELVKSDPERAWPMVLELLRAHPESAAAGHLIEDFVYEHDERFIDRIEAAALADPILRDIVDQAYVGGFASVGAERFHRLQDRLRRGGDL